MHSKQQLGYWADAMLAQCYSSTGADVDRLKGVVKWLNSATGYAFIGLDDDRDLFVHFTGIASEEYESLQKGDTVEFEIAQGPKGLQAVNVKIS